jgi:hypothetical protein
MCHSATLSQTMDKGEASARQRIMRVGAAHCRATQSRRVAPRHVCPGNM